MKKIISVLLVVVMLLCLMTGCAKTETSAPVEEPAKEEAAAPAAPATATADDPYADCPEMTLIYATSSAESVNYCTGATMMAEKVAEATNGKLTIECYFNGSFGLATADEKNALARGTIHMMPATTQILSAEAPYLYPFSVAYVYESYEHFRTVMDSELWADINEQLAADVGIRFLRGDYTGFRHLNLKGTPDINTPEDMAGIKLRVSNNESTLLMAENVLGANPVGLDFSELYQALQTGTVDGHENPFPTIIGNKLYEVTDSIVLTGHTIETHALAVNEEMWKNLPDAYRELINEAWNEACLWVDEKSLADEEDGKAFLEGEGLVVMDCDRQSFIDKATEYYKNFEGMQPYMDTYLAIKEMAK